jgi:hypothetical protein
MPRENSSHIWKISYFERAFQLSQKPGVCVIILSKLNKFPRLFQKFSLLSRLSAARGLRILKFSLSIHMQSHDNDSLAIIYLFRDIYSSFVIVFREFGSTFKYIYIRIHNFVSHTFRQPLMGPRETAASSMYWHCACNVFCWYMGCSYSATMAHKWKFNEALCSLAMIYIQNDYYFSKRDEIIWFSVELLCFYKANV